MNCPNNRPYMYMGNKEKWMGAIQKTTSLWQAFKAGKELANAAVWKDNARLTGAISAALAAVFGVLAAWGYYWNISQDDLVAIASGIVGMLSVYHTIVHTVTSAKVGFGVADAQVEAEPAVGVQHVCELAPGHQAQPGTAAVQPTIPGPGINAVAADQRTGSGNQLQGKGNKIDPDDVM